MLPKMQLALLFALILIGVASAIENNSKDGVDTRVEGGHYAVLGQFPWNAAVIDDLTSKFMCSASLISNRHLLTTAECVNSYAPRGILVVLGALQPTSPSTRYGIIAIAVPSNYIPGNHVYNIAILKTINNVILNAFIAPIALDTGSEPVADGTFVQLCGWGGPKISLRTALEFGYMSTKNVYICIDEIAGIPSVEYFYNLCTPGYQPATGSYTGACSNDHGAGLVMDYNTSPVLVGLVSIADCDTPESTIYTSIVAHHNWILVTMPLM